MSSSNERYERYERILEPLYRLAKEGKTQGERDAARSRIKAIEEKSRPIESLSYVQDALNRLTRINMEAEAKRKAEAERQEKQQQSEIKNTYKKSETSKRKTQTKRNKQDSMWKMRKFEARANYINVMIQDIMK